MMPYSSLMVDVSPARVVHVHTVRPDRPDVRAVLDRCRALLSADELERAGRFHFDRDRDCFVLGRALTRLQLSRWLGGDPRAWRFVTNLHGRPELAGSAGRTLPLGFNVSHTRGLVACAVADTRDVGVDVERVDRHLTHDVAERFFAPREVADLRARPSAEQARVFFDYWTLKEAYIKARGLGLALPLAHFAFTLSAEGPPTIAFDPEIADAPDTWQFFQAWPTPTHRLALAVRRGPEGARTIRLEEWVPRVDA